MIDHFAAFLSIAILVIVTPGPDTALVIRNALVGGGRAGVVTSAGVVAGQAIWTLAASAGGLAILRASAPVFGAVKLVGACYLVVVGLQVLLGALRGAEAGERGAGAGSSRGIGSAAAFRSGVINNLANPKSAVFFTSLLPQFVVPGQGAVAAFLLLGGLYCAFTLAWLVGYSVVLTKAGALLRQPKARRAVEGIAGAALMMFGVRLAIQHSSIR